jgi:hypothetical protein
LIKGRRREKKFKLLGSCKDGKRFNSAKVEKRVYYLEGVNVLSKDDDDGNSDLAWHILENKFDYLLIDLSALKSESIFRESKLNKVKTLK